MRGKEKENRENLELFYIRHFFFVDARMVSLPYM